MTKQTASARRAAKTAKAQAKKAKAKAKRAARAQAKGEKEDKAKALAITRAKEIDKLLGQLKSLVDNACERFATDMHEAAELAFRLQDEFGLTQFKIGAAIGRSQQWVSGVLIWRSKGYPDTAFGPQAKQARAKLLPVTGKVAPDPNLGMPPGPKLALLPDNTIVRATGNDVDTEASAKTRKAAASETEPRDATAAATPKPKPEPAPLTPEEISDDLLSKAKKFWREEIAAGITDDDVKKYQVFISDEKQWKPRTRRAA
jgi:hypothetical protein